MVYSNQGKYKNAITSLQKALSIRPEYVLAYKELGNIFRDIGELDEAVKFAIESPSPEPEDALLYIYCESQTTGKRS